MDKDLKEQLWVIFKEFGQDALAMSHYDLAEQVTDYDVETWKTFLLERDVITWVTQELKLLQESEMKKIVKGISNSNSVGQAQLMTALGKMQDNKAIKDGPVFIYTHVPLSDQQKQAQNANELDKDIFKKEE